MGLELLWGEWEINSPAGRNHCVMTLRPGAWTERNEYLLSQRVLLVELHCVLKTEGEFLILKTTDLWSGFLRKATADLVVESRREWDSDQPMLRSRVVHLDAQTLVFKGATRIVNGKESSDDRESRWRRRITSSI
jgi:hypothetical protein